MISEKKRNEAKVDGGERKVDDESFVAKDNNNNANAKRIGTKPSSNPKRTSITKNASTKDNTSSVISGKERNEAKVDVDECTIDESLKSLVAKDKPLCNHNQTSNTPDELIKDINSMTIAETITNLKKKNHRGENKVNESDIENNENKTNYDSDESSSINSALKIIENRRENEKDKEVGSTSDDDNSSKFDLDEVSLEDFTASPEVPSLPKLSNNVGIQSIGKHDHIEPPPGCSYPQQKGPMSKLYMEDIKNKVPKNLKLQVQKGLSQRSVIVCPNIYLYDRNAQNQLSYDKQKGPFALAKVVQVPNNRKMVESYILKYHDDHDEKNRWITELPKNDFVKKYLQEGVERANSVHWRYKEVAKEKHSEKSKQKRTKKVSAPSAPKGNSTNSANGTILLSGILEEEDLTLDEGNTEVNGSTVDVSANDGSSVPMSGNICTDSEKPDEESSGDEGSQIDVLDSAYADAFSTSSDSDINLEKDDDEKEAAYLGEEWQWDCWADHCIDEEIEGPKEYDHYSGPHGLKPNIGKRFFTVLQCMFETTAMNRSFFVRLCSESNKQARKVMTERNTSLFLGHKWTNISVEEMIHFFGIMLRISLSPRKMGGYDSYFNDNINVTLSNGYSTNLRGYGTWAKEIMSLLRFKQIRSAFRSETIQVDSNDKCYQLRWFIRRFNFMARKTFHLGPHASFDEGGIPMRSRFCPVRQYNKDKPAKYRVDFFILADSRDYFIYHLDVYQGKNKANVDIHPSVRSLPTTQKAVANSILKSGINNDKDGCRYLYMDNRYAAPQLFALMLTNYNIRAVGTCKANRKGFESDRLQLDKKANRGTYVRLHDKRLGMIITRWKDSKNLQTVSTVMKPGSQKVIRRQGANLIEVTCPNDIVLYQQHMGGVDRGDQHRMVGAGFANVAHFKKWYKKTFFGIADFCLLQAFTAWNLSVDQLQQNRRGNSDVKRKKIIKWEFYSVLAEEMMMYVDSSHGDDDTDTNKNMSMTTTMKGHIPAPTSQFDKHETTKRPLCMVCSMDEMARAKVLNLSRSQSRNRKYSRRAKYIAKCMHNNCHVVAHAAIPEQSKVSSLPCFGGLTCFEIAHHPRCKDMFSRIERNGKIYCRTIPSHSVVEEVKDLYRSDLPRRSERSRPPRVGRPPTTIQPSDEHNTIESPLTNEGLRTPVASPDVNPIRIIRTRLQTQQEPTPTITTQPSKRITRQITSSKTKKTRELKRTRSATATEYGPKRSSKRNRGKVRTAYL